MTHRRKSDDFLDVPNVPPSTSPPAYARGHFDATHDARRAADRQKPPGFILDADDNDDMDTFLSTSQQSALVRGLQVPCRTICPTSGFSLPEVLEQAGISEREWKAFTHEVKHHANLRVSQWMTLLGASLALGLVLNWFGVPPALLLCKKLREGFELENFEVAGRNGALAMCAERWNEQAFQNKGMLVRVDIPGHHKGMKNMDLSTSKLYRYQQKTGSSSPAAGAIRPLALGTKNAKKELRYHRREGRARVKAALKARIVVVPLDQVYPTT